MNSIFKTFILSALMIAQVHFAFAQTASILPPAETTFLDQNGHPLSGGQVFFYIPSTTTPKTTWQDAAETIPNTNPVVLNSSGRGIILGSGSYRQIVKDQYGNLIWDQVTSSTGSGGGSTPTATGDGDLVGTIKPWAGLTAPNQYMFAYGETVSRTTFSVLFTAITSTQGIFCSSGSAILTGLTDTTNFWIGMPLEVSCVTSGQSTIISKTSTTITMAANSNVSVNTTATFFPWGNGNGSSTFTLPDLRGLIPVGNNNMGGVASSNLTSTYFGNTNPNSEGAPGGGQSATLTVPNLPSITSVNASQAISVSSTPTDIIQGGITVSNGVPGSGLPGLSNGATSASVASTGTANVSVTSTGTIDTPFGIIPPSKTVNYIIKVTPDANSAVASGVTSLGGMTGSITCGTGLTCTGNTIGLNTSGGNVTNVTITPGNGISATGTCTITSSGSCTVSILSCANILSYGGNNNGTNSPNSNDTPYTNATSSLATNGGCIYFPTGKYYFTSAISTTFPNSKYSISIIGDGSNLTNLYWPNVNGGIVINAGNNNNSFNFSHLHITTAQAGSGTGVFATGINNMSSPPPSFIEDVLCTGDDFTGLAGSDYWGACFNLKNWGNITLRDVNTYGPINSTGGGVGISYGGNATATSYATILNIYGGSFNFASPGIALGNYWQGIIIDGINCNGESGNACIQQAGSASGVLAGLKISGSQMNTKGNQIDINTGVDGVIISGNIGITCFSASCIAINLSNSAEVSIQNNQITLTGSAGSTTGILTNGPTGVISGNVCVALAVCANLASSSSGWIVSLNPGFSGKVVNNGSGNSIGTASAGNMTGVVP